MDVILTMRNGRAIAAGSPNAIVVDMAERAIRFNGQTVLFSPAVFRFAAGVICASGRLVTRANLIEALWGDDEEGGPNDPNKLLDVYLHKSRQKLVPLGLGISTHWGYGVKAETHVVPTKMMLAQAQASREAA